MADLASELQRHLDLAWCGGVLDVGGRFVLWARSDHVSYQPRVVFAPHGPTVPGIPLKLQDVLGGAIAVVPKRRGSTGKLSWRLIGSKRCLPALEALIPYLAVQREPARIVAAYCRRVVEYKSPVFPAVIDESEKDARRKLAQELFFTTSGLQSQRR